MKSFKIRLPILVIIIILCFIFRFKILKSLSSFLVKESSIEYVDTGFVLSGGAFDRGNEAASLVNNNKVKRLICVGENKPPDFKALGIDMLESELTRKNIIAQIQDSTKVTLLKIGTSTLEESEAILEYCKSLDLKECLIISSKFHTRRIHNVFVKKFKEEGIKVYIKGAASSSYSEREWWKSENGLIALNNEYIKLMYYLVK